MDQTVNFSSQDFLDQLRSRDNSAIEKIIKAYTGQILRASLGLGFDRSAADELVQSVWVTFFDVVKGFRGQSHIRTFIFGILYNKASELRREHKKQLQNDPIEDVFEQQFDHTGHWLRTPMDPERMLIATQDFKIIEECLNELPLAQRMAFYLREMDGEDTAHICKIMDISATNLGVLLHRARNRLRICIERKMEGKH